MKTIFKTILFVLVSALAGQSTARGEALSFTLSQAQQYALQNSYITRTTSADIAKAQKRVWETIASGLPQVSGTGSWNKFLNLPVSLIPGEFFGEQAGTYIPVKFGQDYSSDFGFTVSQMVFDGSYIVGVGSSQVYLNLALQAHEKTEIDIRHAVAQSYYLALVGAENLKVMEENLTNSSKMLAEVEAYYKNGFREEQDVDQMKMLVRTAENEVIKAKREITIAHTVLKYTMGMPLDQELTLADSLQFFVAPLTGKSGSTGLDFSRHIDYRLAETQYTAANKLLKLEKSAFLPRMSIFYNWGKTAYSDVGNVFRSSQAWYPTSLAGITLSLPIFSSGQRVMKVHQARISLDQAQYNRDLAAQTISKDYLVAQANKETAIEKLDNDIENRDLALKILEKGKIKFNHGLASSTELMQLETQYLQSHGAYIGSVLQLLQSDLELRKAMGIL